MKILIFGGDGMLGHQLFRAWRLRHDVRVTLRQDANTYARFQLFDARMAYFGVNVRSLPDVVDVLADAQPNVVINAVGIVKQRPTAKEIIPNLEVNAVFPHRLAQMCRAIGARVIQFSSDCVFSGLKGNYRESDAADANDLYGRTKFLGELHEPHCLTLRTSIIGLELWRKQSLIEWYLAQRGPVQGFRRAIYSGLTTAEMARAVEHVLLYEPDLSGLWHLASSAISKYDLLKALTERLRRRDVDLQPQDEFVCDRSLDSTALLSRVKYRVPPWNVMLDQLAASILERDRQS